jgi:hypothetical protein
MFYRADPSSVIFECGTPGGVCNEITVRFDQWPPGQVNTLELKSVAGVRGTKGHINHNACMQAGSGDTYGLFERMLFIGIELCVHQ